MKTWSLPQGSNHSGMISSWGLWCHHWKCPLKMHNFMELSGNGSVGASKLVGAWIWRASCSSLISAYCYPFQLPPGEQLRPTLPSAVAAHLRPRNNGAATVTEPLQLQPMTLAFFTLFLLGICHSDGNGRTELCCASSSLHCTCPPWGWWSCLDPWIITVAELSDMMNPVVSSFPFLFSLPSGFICSPLFFSECRPSLLLSLFLNSCPLFLRL